jgi:uncharacterized lipoprotein
MAGMTRSVLALILAAWLLPGCSLFRDKPPEYLASEEGTPLKVPEDLDPVDYLRPVEITVPLVRMPSGDELNPGPPRAVSTGGRGDANAYLAWSAEGVYLQVKDTPDSVARRLGYAIERSGMALIERDAAGSHKFEYTHMRIDDRGFFKKLLFWRSDEGPNYSGSYRIRLQADQEQTRVYLLYGTGGHAATDAAEHILGIFMERLG